MLEWLKDSPVSPVSKNAENENWEAANPHGYAVPPVSQFPQLKNKGAAQQLNKTANACEKKPAPISQPHPDLLNAVAARLGRLASEDLQTQAGGNSERLADLCRLALAAPPSPTPEDVAELDALMVRLCELEPWLAGYLPEMQAARRRMAPGTVAESLACFRRYVREAEARRGAVMGAGIGSLSALESEG
jgi:hypothetical protein